MKKSDNVHSYARESILYPESSSKFERLNWKTKTMNMDTRWLAIVI